MSKSPQAAQLHHHNTRPPPQQSPPAEPTSSQSPHQKTTSSATEPHSTKPFEFPFRYLIRDSVDPISPPPTDEAPPLNENSLENQITAPIQQTSQQPLSERDETEVFTQCESVLEDAGSPMLQMDRSPENPVVASRMAASPLATMEAKIGRGGVNGKSVESGVLRRVETKKAELGLRVLEVILCMISFSVMAADKTTGWAGDSFERYQEFRYCVSMNVIGFVYSVFQVYAQFYWRMKRRRIIDRPLSYYLDFSMDQALAYLLMSASSSAAARNDDWISMFGNDKFTDMIKGSIAMSFLAFLAFALSSIISADKLFSWNL